jgi:anti-sigma factor ChrR (cupin superfamily)
MKPIKPEDRRIANIFEDEFKPIANADGSTSQHETALQINSQSRLGVGFHVYRMAPGTQTAPHEHNGDEEFLVLEGELADNDGQVYRKGDLVWLKDGTQHTSYSKDGALLAVYIPAQEKSV